MPAITLMNVSASRVGAAAQPTKGHVVAAAGLLTPVDQEEPDRQALRDVECHRVVRIEPRGGQRCHQVDEGPAFEGAGSAAREKPRGRSAARGLAAVKAADRREVADECRGSRRECLGLLDGRHGRSYKPSRRRTSGVRSISWAPEPSTAPRVSTRQPHSSGSDSMSLLTSPPKMPQRAGSPWRARCRWCRV
jgi:hypothetical protein